jgi:serine/threonine protein kinase
VNRPTAQPDFSILLRDLLVDPNLGANSRRSTRSPPVEHPTQYPWPQLESAARDFAKIYQQRPDALGSFKRIGRAAITPGQWIETTSKPSEFQGWLPFASRQQLELKGAFFEVEVEVESGEIAIAILAEDGSNFVGRRYLARRGYNRFQLPILSNEVKGAVFCNGEAADASARFKISSSSVIQLDRTSPDFKAFKYASDQELTSPQTETNHPESIAPSPSFVLHYLLGRGEIHAVRTLLHASQALGENPLSNFPARMIELLAQFNEVDRSADPSTPNPAAARENCEHPPSISNRALDELNALRLIFEGNQLVPLHLEILEFGFAIELAGVVTGQNTEATWHRESIASALVPRGLLRKLLEVISERLQGDISQLVVSISTTSQGTTLAIRSRLQNGDLQYRNFSDQVAKLHEALNHPGVRLPHLVHHLGGENQLELSWGHENSACDLPPLTWSSSTPEETDDSIYRGELGGQIRLVNGLCYKVAPRPSSKPNDLRQEAFLLQKLSGLGIVPTVGASQVWPDRTAMSYGFISGITLDQWNISSRSTGDKVHVLQQLSDAISELNNRGIQHRDLRAQNILIKPDHRLVILDFDQAREAPAADDFGNEWGADDVCSGFGGLIRQLRWEKVYLETAGKLGFAWELGRTSAANSPGNHSCYYAWRWGALDLHGERPWVLRWKLLETAFPSTPGQFLELGCNLGLLSTYASLNGWQTTGLDHDGVAVAAADQIASALYSSAQFRTADLTSPDAFSDLDDTYDIVSALSVVHWLPDPGPVEAFLQRQPRLIFEGHRTLAEEETYLHRLGFSSVKLIGYSERLRPVILAIRNPELANS